MALSSLARFQLLNVRLHAFVASILAAFNFILDLNAESRRGLGLAVVGGLLVSQLLTLYIAPVVYYYMDRLQSFAMRRRKIPVEAVYSADM